MMMKQQNFLKSAAARSLSLAQIFRLSDDEAYGLLKSMRWEDGEPTCPHCGGCKVYELASERRFKCAACRKKFSLTSGTLFASYKRPLRDYLAAIFLFTNGAKGVSALQLGRDLNVSYKTAFVLCHKLREAMAADAPKSLDGIVEIDGSYYGGHVREANVRAERVDRRRTTAWRLPDFTPVSSPASAADVPLPPFSSTKATAPSSSSPPSPQPPSSIPTKRVHGIGCTTITRCAA